MISREENLKQLSSGGKVYDLDDDESGFEFTRTSPQASFPRIKTEPAEASLGTQPAGVIVPGYVLVSPTRSRGDEIEPLQHASQRSSDHLRSNAGEFGHRCVPSHDSSGSEESIISSAKNGIFSDADVPMSNHDTPRTIPTGDLEAEVTQDGGLQNPNSQVGCVQTDLSNDNDILMSDHTSPHVESAQVFELETTQDNAAQSFDISPAVIFNHENDVTNHQRAPSTDNGVGPQSDIPVTGPVRTSATTINLGSSIFQRKCPEVAIDPVLARQAMLEQQKQMAATYRAATQASRRREIEQPANPEEDQTIYQGQQIGQISYPYDFELDFQEERRKYMNSKINGTTTVDAEVRFFRLESQYNKQNDKTRREFEGQIMSSGEENDEDLFVKDASRKRGRNGKATANGKQKAKGKGKGRGNDSSCDEDVECPIKKAKCRTKTKAASTRSRKLTSKSVGRLNHMSFGTSNVLGDAEAAEGLQRDQPGWNDSNDVGKCRAKALRALMNNVPAASLAIARTDKTVLNQAIRNFTGVGCVKPAEGGKWLVNGMSTPLTPHQVIGAAFMRQRESRGEQPKGGILADQMGLGKTLMALANIVNGRPNPKSVSGRDIPVDQQYTTLIVVPTALITQWQDEIRKHVKNKRRGTGWGIGGVFVYNERNCGSLVVEDLYNYDIVLTTYGEVAKSWPVIEIPALEDGPEKDQWFQDHFFEKRGLLHKAHFLRVCLDEAHCIRNVETKTSTACRNLVGEHCWAITGTPMVNSSFDLYALFEFIRHPTVKCPNGFRKKYVDPQHPMSVDKFSDDLSNCMSRFTHRDHLFGARLVNLPKARGETLRLNFTRLEFAIYEIVRTRFAARVQKMSDEGNLRSKLTHIWVLMLRLRQLTAHPLMIQGEICSCLEREDFEKLERLVERERSVRGDGTNLILTIRNVLLKERAAAERRIAEDHQDGADEQCELSLGAAISRVPAEGDLTGSGGKHGENMRFSKYLKAIKSLETYRRITRDTKCCICQQPPYEPYITNCFHFYCKLCLEDAQFESAEQGYDTVACHSCGKDMTAQPSEETSFNDDEDGSQGPSKKGKKKAGSGDDMESWLDMKGEILPSTKTIATKSQILNWWDPLAGGDPDVKVIIFTQWLGMVKVLSKMCETEKWGYCTLTGDLSQKRKDGELKRFKTNAETKILISSLRCGGLGLNLTVASKVIIIDPWWNDAIEQQAFCRVFRIGQDKETSMVSLAIKGSVDDRLFELKETKKTEIDKVMLDHKERRKVDLKGVLGVFGDVDEDENGRLFFTELEDGRHGGRGGGTSDEDEPAE